MFGLVLAPFAIAFCVWYVIHWVKGSMAGTEQGLSHARAAVTAPHRDGLTPVVKHAGPPSIDDYIEARKPRIAGLDYTAPIYDSVTTPVRAPYPAACVESRERCQCYSQDGTRLTVGRTMCHSIVQNGFFVDFDAGKSSLRSGRVGDRSPEREQPAHAQP